MLTTVLQAASPQWWAVGWVASIAMLLIGYAIGFLYYDDNIEDPREQERDTGGEAA